MRGMSAIDGRPLDGVDHLDQSVRDVLTTPIGSRVMRRTYGARIADLVDQPWGDALRQAVIAATAQALQAWEPRLRVDHVAVEPAGDGHVRIDLDGEYLPAGSAVVVSGVVV